MAFCGPLQYELGIIELSMLLVRLLPMRTKAVNYDIIMLSSSLIRNLCGCSMFRVILTNSVDASFYTQCSGSEMSLFNIFGVMI